MATSPKETLLLLKSARKGEAAAREELLPIVYEEMRRIAGRLFARERDGHTLQPTMLVHDAYLNLVGVEVEWESRKHFLCVAARAMRQVLREHARARGADKRGGGWNRVTLQDGRGGGDGIDLDIAALDEALEKLRELNDRQADVVELRFFAEMTIEETANTLGVSTGTVENDWRFARAWLLHRMRA